MLNNSSNTTDNTLEWFTQNLPPAYLTHPEYFLYSTALDVQQMQDVPENRRRFKQVLVERQVGEGMELPEVDQKQLHDFMNPNDAGLKLQRSEELLELTSIHLEAQQDFAQAQRLAVLELFHKEAPFRQVKMDESYFRNRELVEADLRGYLEHARGDSLRDLNTGKPRWFVAIQAQNGEQVKWQTYLNRASRVLLGTKERGGDRHRPPDALKALLRIAGVDIPEYIPMNEEYFNNPEYVKADLTGYLQHAKGDSLKDLNTKNPKSSTCILTQSGEQVSWQVYLNRASAALLGTKQGNKGKKSNNPHRPVTAIKALFRVIALEILEYTPLDVEYFSNPANVRADLVAYLVHAEGNAFTELKTSDPTSSAAIKAQSGEQITWTTYLRRVSKAFFGTKSHGDNAHRTGDALKKLLGLIGESVSKPMDNEYFTDPEIVKADFTAFLQWAKGDSISCLTTGNPKQSVYVLTQSNEQVRWQTYLNRASVVLLGSKGGKKSTNSYRPSEVLKVLLSTAGVNIPEYAPMDEEYFTDPEIVKADLTAFLKHARGNSLRDLSTSNPGKCTPLLLHSGESVRWETYLDRASGVLFKTKKRGVNSHRSLDALKALLRIVSVKINEYIPMDEEYFTDPEIVKADLTAFLKHARGNSLRDLSTSNPGKCTPLLLHSGERIVWSTYLNRASGVLLGTTFKKDNFHRPPDALKKLIEIVTADSQDLTDCQDGLHD